MATSVNNGALTPEQMAQQVSAPTTIQQGSVDSGGALTPEQMVQSQNSAPAPSVLKSAGKFIVNSANAIERPFIDIAAIPVQLLAKATGQPDPFSAGMPGLPGSDSNISVAPLTGGGILQKAGSLAQIGTLALTPEAAGVSGVLKMAALGAAGAAAQSTAQGDVKSPADFNPFGNSATARAIRQGALFGGILGGLGNAARLVSATEKASGGITPAMENELAQIRPSTLGKYIDVAKTSATDFHAPTIDDVVVSDIKKGADILTSKVIPQAGEAINIARKNAGAIPIVYSPASGGVESAGLGAVAGVRDEINNMMQQLTGHQFASYGTAAGNELKIVNYPVGEKILNEGAQGVEQLPGRAVELSAADTKSLEFIDKQLQVLADNPTVQTASDIVRNLDSKINWDRPQFGAGSSPVDGVLRWARGAINRTIAPAAPELADANATWGALQDVRGAIGDAAGKDLNHVDLLARRTLYAGQSGGAQSVLDTLYSAVKPYLPPGEESYTTKAIIGRFAKDVFAGKRGQTGLSQSISSGDIAAGASGYTSRVVTAGLKAARRALAPDIQQYALSVSKGEPYSFVPLMHHIDEFIDSPSAVPWIQSFKEGLKTIGVSSANTGQAAKDTLRMMMFNNITKPPVVPQTAPVAPITTPTLQPQAVAPTNTPITSNTTQKNLTAIHQLTPAESGQAMARKGFSMNMNTQGNGLSLS